MLPSTNPIPDWDISGVLPASDEDDITSPYMASLSDVVARFGDTDERRRLLNGLLDFRAELHGAGLVRGFQWIDGSFVENVEGIENRAPRDIDVVTFLHIPDQYTPGSLVRTFPALFNHDGIKAAYSVDAYFVPLNQVPPETIVSRSIYWNSLWSHNRGNAWKGYLQVDLSDNGDTDARTELRRLDGMGGQQ